MENLISIFLTNFPNKLRNAFSCISQIKFLHTSLSSFALQVSASLFISGNDHLFSRFDYKEKDSRVSPKQRDAISCISTKQIILVFLCLSLIQREIVEGFYIKENPHLSHRSSLSDSVESSLLKS